jgi:hypothetical protein
MLGDLFVVFKAKIAGFINNVKQMLGITQGATQKINASAKEMEGALNSAFSGQLRNNITNLSENISRTRENIVNLKDELKFLISEQKNQKEGTQAFKDTAKEINNVKKELFKAQQQLAAYNIEARDQKKALADSRLAAEDYSSVMEATSRAVTAASQALLLLGNENENLKPLLRGVSLAMAGVNAVIAVQNLRLRENAVFAKVAAGAQNILRSAFVGATGAATAFKTVLASIGIGAAILIIGQLISKIMEISEATSEAEETQKKFNEEYAKFGGKELSRVRLLIAQVENLTLSLNARKKSLKELQDIFPAYFKNLDDEKILSGQIRIETNKLTTAILKNAKAKALQNRLTEAAEETLIVTQKSAKALTELNKTTKEYEENASNGADVSTFYTSKINRLRNEVTEAAKRLGELSAQSKKYSEEIDRINAQTDPVIGATEEQVKKEKEVRKKIVKIVEESYKAQQDAEIADAKIKGQQALTLATTEEKRAQIINATEQEIIKIKEKYAPKLPQIDAKSQAEALAQYKQFELDKINAQIEADKRSKAARDKDTDALVKAEEDKNQIQKDSLEGMLQMNQEEMDRNTGILAAEYNNNHLTYEQYQERLTETLILYLNKRKGILKKEGQDTLKIEKQIADLSVKQTKKANDDQVRLLEQANRVIQQSFQSLYEDLAESFGNFLASTEMTENPLEKLFGGIIESVGGFMTALGKSIIAIGVAKLQLDAALTSFNGPAAIAAGIALVAAGTATKAIAKQGFAAFADGGIVSGPTLGLVGEYPGASTNPEVIAPLDKLKSIIGGKGEGDGFIAETRISGRDLAVVLNRYNKDNARG